MYTVTTVQTSLAVMFFSVYSVFYLSILIVEDHQTTDWELVTSVNKIRKKIPEFYEIFKIRKNSFYHNTITAKFSTSHNTSDSWRT